MIGFVLTLGLGVSAGYAIAKANKAAELVPAADVKWTPLDPKAGARGPQISVVFGDLKKKAPIGVLLKIPAGAKPGPHTHTSDYWAVVVQGTQHNWPGTGDEGKALPVGSWWFQPGKAVHDNHCEAGTDCVMFVYMTRGFDMMPASPTKAD
jgi:hypothetical protein